MYIAPRLYMSEVVELIDKHLNNIEVILKRMENNENYSKKDLEYELMYIRGELLRDSNCYREISGF